jgi:NAD(P)-dependent dehydrogenase (short-subunit alcohol dehydrogenase family)
MKVLITGGLSGLGKAMALAYASKASHICVIDRNDQDPDNVVQTLKDKGVEVVFQQCDVTDQQQIDALVDTITEQWQRLDVLVNNAGVATVGLLEYEDLDQWQWVMDINLLSVVRMTKSFRPLLKSTANSRIINVASQAGITPAPMMGSYNASKAAVVSFSETMYLELWHDDIHVSVACPAFFKTNLDKSVRTNQQGAHALVHKLLNRDNISADQVANIIIEQSHHNKFMILTHKEGKTAWLLKRFMPYARYLSMMKKKTHKISKARDASDTK